MSCHSHPLSQRRIPGSDPKGHVLKYMFRGTQNVYLLIGGHFKNKD